MHHALQLAVDLQPQAKGLDKVLHEVTQRPVRGFMGVGRFFPVLGDRGRGLGDQYANLRQQNEPASVLDSEHATAPHQ